VSSELVGTRATDNGNTTVEALVDVLSDIQVHAPILVQLLESNFSLQHVSAVKPHVLHTLMQVLVQVQKTPNHQ
jgi:hypothetical protein